MCGPGTEARSVDPSQNFRQPNPFEQRQNDRVRPSPAALSTLNEVHNAAKSGHEKEQIEMHWKNYLGAAQNGAAAARERWTPRQYVAADYATPNVGKAPQTPQESEAAEAGEGVRRQWAFSRLLSFG